MTQKKRLTVQSRCTLIVKRLEDFLVSPVRTVTPVAADGVPNALAGGIYPGSDVRGHAAIVERRPKEYWVAYWADTKADEDVFNAPQPSIDPRNGTVPAPAAASHPRRREVLYWLGQVSKTASFTMTVSPANTVEIAFEDVKKKPVRVSIDFFDSSPRVTPDSEAPVLGKP